MVGHVWILNLEKILESTFDNFVASQILSMYLIYILKKTWTEKVDLLKFLKWFGLVVDHLLKSRCNQSSEFWTWKITFQFGYIY